MRSAKSASPRAGVLGVFAGTGLLAVSAVLFRLAAADRPPPVYRAVSFRYEGELCSRQGCLSETISNFCRSKDVAALQVRIEAIDRTRAAGDLYVRYRVSDGVMMRLERIAARPFTPRASAAWSGPSPGWNAGWCRIVPGARVP